MAEKKLSSVYVSWPSPDFSATVKTHKKFRGNFHAAMLYAHYELSAVELKREVIKYLKSKDPKHALLDRIRDMHENRFTTIGKYMYILNHGADIPEDIMTGLMSALERVINEEEARVEAVEKANSYLKVDGDAKTSAIVKPVISIQDRIRDKAREVAKEVEGWIDDFTINKSQAAKTVDDFVNLYKSNDLKSPHMRYVQDIFSRRGAEIAEALEGKDKDLVEAYSNFSKPELKRCDLFYRNLEKACNMMQEVAKVDRAPRKKKPVALDKVVSKLKFKKEDSALGIVSLNPIHIIGAKEVWTYNTKTRKLSQYKAEDGNTLTVKGASLMNYSPDSAEKTLRKPAEALADFKKASKVKLRTFLKDLTTIDVPCGGKLNEHHVILRIDK